MEHLDLKIFLLGLGTLPLAYVSYLLSAVLLPLAPVLTHAPLVVIFVVYAVPLLIVDQLASIGRI